MGEGGMGSMWGAGTGGARVGEGRQARPAPRGRRLLVVVRVQHAWADASVCRHVHKGEGSAVTEQWLDPIPPASSPVVMAFEGGIWGRPQS
jgi:hypothetical protein